jgi:hypothetical protein
MQFARAEPKESRDRTSDTAVNGARFSQYGVPMCAINGANYVIESLCEAELSFGARRSPDTVIYPDQERIIPCAY